MKLWQIVDQIHGSFGQRFQIPASRVLENVSTAQKMAFNMDCRAFEKIASLPPLLPALAAENGFELATAENGAIMTAESLLSRERVSYRFPEDCRIIKRVFGNPRSWNMSNVHVDDFLREITVRNPADDAIGVVYYRQPPDLTCEGKARMDAVFREGGEREGLFADGDEHKVILPPEWHWQVLVQLGTALCDTENYGDKTPQSVAGQYLNEFWAAMDKRPNDRKVVTSVGAW